MTFKAPRRQIHLDFHVSEHVPDIGVRFAPEAFAEDLVKAGADCVVLFGKCHHGWSYYDTEVGARHPNLAFDLLDAQVEACAAAGVRTITYLSVGWDERAARRHPGWRRILPDGGFHMMLGRNLDPFWSYLCLNTPYREEVLAQIREMASRFGRSEGIWLDIIRQHECCCHFCRDAMDAAGLDWRDAAARRAFAKAVFDAWIADSTAAVRGVRPDWALFHNTSLVPRGDRSLYQSFSHIEIEAVPTGGWGYDHFPLSARYVDPMGRDFLGVTTRFHFVWGELGAVKHPHALEAELAVMQAHGARVCVGDQLGADGVLDPDALDMIGRSFARVRERETVLDGTLSVADVGLLSSVAVRDPGAVTLEARKVAEDEGALRVLQQSGFLFDVLDLDSLFEAYRVLVLPDRIRLSPALAERLSAYCENGGRVVMTAESGLDLEGRTFALDPGARLVGPSPLNHTYLTPRPGFSPDYARGPMLVWSPSFRAVRTVGRVLAEVTEPYFDRSARRFSGHIATPARPTPSDFVGAVEKAGVTWLAHPLFTHYREWGHAALRDFVAAVIDDALGDRSLRTSAPRAATVTLRRGPAHDLVQIVYAPRELRGASPLGPIEVIEDLPRLESIAVDLDAPRPVREVLFGPARTPLSFNQTGGRLRFVTPPVEGTAFIVVTRADQGPDRDSSCFPMGNGASLA